LPADLPIPEFADRFMTLNGRKPSPAVQHFIDCAAKSRNPWQNDADDVRF
jgi:hypothetical protein